MLFHNFELIRTLNQRHIKYSSIYLSKLTNEGCGMFTLVLIAFDMCFVEIPLDIKEYSAIDSDRAI